MANILIIGASGKVGSQVSNHLIKNSGGHNIVLSTSQQETAERWQSEGKNAVVLDLNKPEEFSAVLENVDRLFLLTGYTADMLFQAKSLIDAAKKSNVNHIVHLGVYTSRNDPIPHYTWHDLIENYIASSGIAWTNVHPNVITESILDMKPSVLETGMLMTMCGNALQGYVCAKDIGEVVAAVLKEGPDKHAGKDYYLSIEVMTASDLVETLHHVTGKKISIQDIGEEQQNINFREILSPSVRTYLESAAVVMDMTRQGKYWAQTVVQDDVYTVTGHKGTSMRQWILEHFS